MGLSSQTSSDLNSMFSAGNPSVVPHTAKSATELAVPRLVANAVAGKNAQNVCSKVARQLQAMFLDIGDFAKSATEKRAIGETTVAFSSMQTNALRSKL